MVDAKKNGQSRERALRMDLTDRVIKEFQRSVRCEERSVAAATS